MATATTEERLAALEAEVARIKSQLHGERYGVTGRTNPRVLEEMFGVFGNNPHAEQVLRSIEEEREKERAEARQQATDEEQGETG